MKYGILFILIIVSAVVIRSSAFIVSEAEQALVTQFGEIKGDPITSAGLHFKVPFIQEARYFDKRILTWDGDEEQIPTKDKKYIWVDTTARWRIVDVIKFAQTLNTENQAKAKLDTILDGITRDTISNHNLVEAVRNSNSIIKAIEERNAAKSEKADSEGHESIEESISGEIEPISVGRENLSRQIIKRSSKDLKRFGIELIDVQLRRIAYETSVERKVYDRMISERKRIAEKIRSIGKGEEAKIAGKLNKDLKKIESEAYRTSQSIKGKAEAKAIRAYGNTMSQDPKYYNFIRTMEAYKKTIPGNVEFVMSSEAEFLKYFNKL